MCGGGLFHVTWLQTIHVHAPNYSSWLFCSFSCKFIFFSDTKLKSFDCVFRQSADSLANSCDCWCLPTHREAHARNASALTNLSDSLTCSESPLTASATEGKLKQTTEKARAQCVRVRLHVSERLTSPDWPVHWVEFMQNLFNSPFPLIFRITLSMQEFLLTWKRRKKNKNTH